MLLAQKGYSVALLDRASFPSDTVSTHIIKHPGVNQLEKWGLLDNALATVRRSISFVPMWAIFDFAGILRRKTESP